MCHLILLRGWTGGNGAKLPGRGPRHADNLRGEAVMAVRHQATTHPLAAGFWPGAAWSPVGTGILAAKVSACAGRAIIHRGHMGPRIPASPVLGLIRESPVRPMKTAMARTGRDLLAGRRQAALLHRMARNGLSPATAARAGAIGLRRARTGTMSPMRRVVSTSPSSSRRIRPLRVRPSLPLRSISCRSASLRRLSTSICVLLSAP